MVEAPPEDAPLTAYSVVGGPAVTSLSAEQMAARKRRQVRYKARRILREAIRMATEDVSVAQARSSSGVGKGADALIRLARVAVETRKCSDALMQSELLADLGELQLSMMASSGKQTL